MRRILHLIGKFYSKVIINLIGIFIFVGISSVLFGENGWFPNEDIYAISDFLYKYVIPILFAYICGGQIMEASEEAKQEKIHVGGALAIMAEASILVVNPQIGFLGSMVLGPLCGIIWGKFLEPFINRWNLKIDMLVRNLLVAGVGILFSLASLFFVAPFLTIIDYAIMQGISYLIVHRTISLISLLIEPAKIFFLNNSIHHGLLIPLGMQQTMEQGKSVLFLLETNPGPGLGVLLALYLVKKERRKEYAASMFVHFIGGIHEIYFPAILSNVWLLLATVAGGMVGNFYFAFFDIGAVSAISPGSVITFLLVCSKTDILGAFIGVALSAITSLAVAYLILQLQEKRGQAGKVQEECNDGVWKMRIRKIGVVCDAGVGSSAMGAALLRRMLREKEVDVEVAAYAVDQIPTDLSLIVCQSNFKQMIKEYSQQDIYTISSLLNQEELRKLVERICEGNI